MKPDRTTNKDTNVRKNPKKTEIKAYKKNKEINRHAIVDTLSDRQSR